MTSRETPVTKLTDESGHHFFGFYDLSPWSGSDRYVLCHRTDLIDRLPTANDPADICLIDTDKSDTTVATTTTAWNYQLGARLQWLGPDYEDQFLYNDRRDDGQLVARIHSLASGPKRTLERPIYAADPSGATAVTMDFRRFRTGYTYEDTDHSDLDPIPDDDGIWSVDLSDSDSELLVSYAELASYDPVETMQDGHHWIDHVTYAPSGDRIAFLHRWELADGGLYTRLFTANANGSNLRCLTNSGKATHYDWRSDNKILVWTRQQERISNAAQSGLFANPLVKPVVGLVRKLSIPSNVRQSVMGDGFYLIDTVSGASERVGTGVLRRDGHPHFAHDGRWMVSDTYPDSSGKRHLYIYDFEGSERIDIATLDSLPEHDGTGRRCDLHPRWNRAGETVCVDSYHTGTRQLYAFDMTEYTHSD